MSEKLPADWRITRDDVVSVDAGLTYYSESILWHREPRRYGFLWLKKRLAWRVHSKRFAGCWGSRHAANEKYFRELIRVEEL